MNTPIIVALVSAAAGIIASALTFFLTKKKEREAEWRKHKLEHYKEFMAALNEIVGRSAPEDAKVRFASAANNIFLIGSYSVLTTLRNYLDEVAESKQDHNKEKHDEMLTNLIFAIREDLEIGPDKPINNYIFHLWSGRPRS